MPLFGRGRAPKYLRLGTLPVTHAMQGAQIVFDGTIPVALTLPLATATALARLPGLAAAADLMPPTATAVSEAKLVTVTAGGRIMPPPAQATSVALVPQIAAGAGISLPIAAAAASALTPTVQAVEAGEILLPTAHAVAQAHVPTVAVVAIIAPPTATAVSEALVPIITASGVVAPPVASASADALPISVAAGASVAAPRAQATASALLPTVGGGASVSLPTATATATAPGATASTGVTYTDNFNRANGALGSNWTTLTAAPVINTNKAQGGTSGPNSAATIYAARYTTAVLTDTQRAECIVVTPTGTAALGLGAGPIVRCDSSGNRVEALVTSNSAHIFTRIGGTATQRAQQTGLTIASGTAVKLTAVGNVYSLYLAGSGTPTVTWTDSGNVITIGSTTRYVGFVSIAQKDGFGNATYAYAIDDWVGADI